MKALIAGAGIGGLTAALFLHRQGIGVEILERADAVRELGVGINMLPHAVKELAELGLMADLDAQGIRTRELIYANRFGQIVWQELRGVDAGYDVPQISIHRGKLLGVIHRAVVARLGPGAIHTDCRVTGFEQRQTGVAIQFERSDGTEGQAEGDLLIGADGIHSTVRAALYPDEGPPIWNGITLWRGATEWPIWRDGRTMAIAGGNSAKFVCYPIKWDPVRAGTRLTNWAVMARTDESRVAPSQRGDWNRPAVVDEVVQFVRDHLQLDFVDVAELILSTDPVYEYPCCDREPLPRWSFGRVTLLGDAAHPMYPVGSNGASQAILDAKNLALHLGSAGTIEDALQAYDAERRAPTSQLVLANRVGGPERVIDMVEARAPQGFDDIDAIATREEREAVVRGYSSMAGFAKEQVNKPAGRKQV